MPCAVVGDKRNTPAGPLFAGSEAPGCLKADLYPVAGRVGNVKRFRDQVILGAVPHAGGPQPDCHSGQFLSGRDVDGDMKKIAGLWRQGGCCSVVQHNEGLAVDAEFGCPVIPGEGREADHVTPDR